MFAREVTTDCVASNLGDVCWQVVVVDCGVLMLALWFARGLCLCCLLAIAFVCVLLVRLFNSVVIVRLFRCYEFLN